MPCCEDCPCVNYCDGSMIEACMDDWRKRKQKESGVIDDEKFYYCYNCGQKLDWESEVEYDV